jgi:hypothetical protein
VSSSDDDTPRYHHDPDAGETHPPDPDADPHAPLNTPVSEIEDDADWERVGRRESVADVTGMGRPQTSDTRGSEGDPVLRPSDDEREARNPGQSTPFGELDPEQDALHRVEEHTGVRLSDDERNSA